MYPPCRPLVAFRVGRCTRKPLNNHNNNNCSKPKLSLWMYLLYIMLLLCINFIFLNVSCPGAFGLLWDDTSCGDNRRDYNNIIIYTDNELLPGELFGWNEITHLQRVVRTVQVVSYRTRILYLFGREKKKYFFRNNFVIVSKNSPPYVMVTARNNSSEAARGSGPGPPTFVCDGTHRVG